MFELGWRTLSVGFLLIFSLYRKRLSHAREKNTKEDIKVREEAARNT